MSYIDLINSFWQSYKRDKYSGTDVVVYLYLLNECNARFWQNPFELQTRDLELYLDVSRKTIAEVRRRLIERGLIEIVEAKGRGATAYFIVGADVTNDELYELFVLPTGNTKQSVVLPTGNTKGNTKGVALPQRNTKSNTKCVVLPTGNTKGNTKGNTTPNSTLLNKDLIKTIKDNSPNGQCARAENSSDVSLFSEREIERITPKGKTAAQLSKFSPPTVQEVQNFFLSLSADIRIPDWESESQAFFSYYDSQDWVKSNGRKVSNWESLATDWILRRERELKQQNQHERHSTNRGNNPDQSLADAQAQLAERIHSRRCRPPSAGDSGAIP